MAPFDVTATTDPAIAQVTQGHSLLVDLLNDVLPPNHGQICP
jgi:hypothetical protein